MEFLYTRADFAKLLGIKKPSITYAVKKGLVELDENSLVDLRNPVNLKYAQDKGGNPDHNAIAKIRQKRAHKTKKVIKPAPTDPKMYFDEPEFDFSQTDQKKYVSKTDADVQRIQAQTANLQLKFAERMKVLVLRDLVDRAFGNFNAIIHNFFLPYGERMAPILASICGISDQKIINKLKEHMDKEMTRALNAMKKQLETKI